MKSLRIVSLLLCSMFLISTVGCSSETSSTTSIDTGATTETNIDLNKEVIGTYIGEDGSVLTFLSDGTADYYYQPDGKDPITGQEWTVEGNRVTWDYDGADVYADVENGDVSTLFFKCKNPLAWVNEHYTKASDEAAHWNKEQSDAILRGETPELATDSSTDPTAKEIRNGYNQATNKTEAVGQYRIQVPEYWKADTREEDVYRAYAENESGVAMLLCSASYDEEDTVGYDWFLNEEDHKLAIENFFASFDDAELLSDDLTEHGETKGNEISFSFSINGSKAVGYKYSIASEEDNKWIDFMLAESENCQYSYKDDFIKLLDSIRMAPQYASGAQEGNGSESNGNGNTGTGMPTMAGTSVFTAANTAKSLGLEELYDEDFGHGTRCKSFSDSSGGLMIDIIYSYGSKEILCGNITTNDLASSKSQKKFVKGMSAVLCPKDDSTDVSSWVDSNIGSTSSTNINGFTYEASIGPAGNILYSAGNSEWEAWELRQ